VLHAQVAEETCVLAQLAHDFVVYFGDLVKDLLLIQHVAEALLLETPLILGLEYFEAVLHAEFVFVFVEGVNFVFVSQEACAKEALQEVPHGEVGDFPVTQHQHLVLYLHGHLVLNRQLGLGYEQLLVVFALVLLYLFGRQRQTSNAQGLPDFLFEGVAREAEVQHD